MKMIYAVTEGEYSDYGVVALFSTKELAEDFMRAVPSNKYNAIEEYELNPPVADRVRRGYGIWNVHMLRDGTVESVNKTETSSYTMNNTAPTIWDRPNAPAFRGKGIPACLTCFAWAKTEKQAVKIVNEMRTRMIAEGKWPESEAL